MTFDEAMRIRPLIAILRGVTPEEVVAIGEALVSAGFTAVETPLNSPDAIESVARLAASLGRRLCVGAGTVLTAQEAVEVARRGGRFIVAPNTDPAVIRATLEAGAVPLPGFGTATEAFSAVQAGARALKLFPASTYGLSHLRALCAVLPSDVSVFAVGGVDPSGIAGWLEAGAAGFGVGSEVYRRGYDRDSVRERAAAFVQAYEAARRTP